MITTSEEYNLFNQSSDEDMITVEEEPSEQKKDLDIFNLFKFLNDPDQLASKLRYYNILKNNIRCPSQGCRRNESGKIRSIRRWVPLALRLL